jgi:hypothetical protein
MGRIAIQVAVPPKNTISPDIQSIAILNRSMTPGFVNLQNYSIEKSLVTNYRSFENTFYDSIAADTAVMEAARAIFASQRFDVVIPLQMNIIRDDNDRIVAPLDSSEINKLCKEFNVDAVLVLESFSEKLNGNIYSNETNSFHYLFNGVIDVTYGLAWRFYSMHQNPPVQSFVVSDAIFWDTGLNRSPREAYGKMVTVKDALIGGGIASGQDIANQICPNWVDDIRYYFVTKNENIDAAIPLIKENKWDEASAIWIKYASESSKTLRCKIEYNLALAAEMNGDINQAIEWGAKSLKTKYIAGTDNYLKYLSLRRSNAEKSSRTYFYFKNKRY